MQTTGQYSWAKHLDFLAVDLFSLILAFFLAYYRKFHTLTLNDEWERFIVLIVLFNVLTYLAANPYGEIFYRRYYHEIGRGLVLAGVNVVCMTIVVYILKIGTWYSREVFLVTYSLYYLLSLLLKYLWKKLLVSNVLGLYKGKKRSLFLICDEEHAQRDIHSVYSTELPLYAIQGICPIRRKGGDTPLSELSYREAGFTEQVPVVTDHFVEYILEHNISEVLVTTRHSRVDASDYQRMTANGVTVSFAVDALLGFQSEEQSVEHIGVNRALSVGEFSFTPLQDFYLLFKRLFDLCCAYRDGRGYCSMLPCFIS